MLPTQTFQPCLTTHTQDHALITLQLIFGFGMSLVGRQLCCVTKRFLERSFIHVYSPQIGNLGQTKVWMLPKPNLVKQRVLFGLLTVVWVRGYLQEKEWLKDNCNTKVHTATRSLGTEISPQVDTQCIKTSSNTTPPNPSQTVPPTKDSNVWAYRGHSHLNHKRAIGPH